MFYHLHLLHVCSFTIHPLVINHWQLQTNESCMKQKYLNGFRILNLFLNLNFFRVKLPICCYTDDTFVPGWFDIVFPAAPGGLETRPALAI